MRKHTTMSTVELYSVNDDAVSDSSDINSYLTSGDASKLVFTGEPIKYTCKPPSRAIMDEVTLEAISKYVDNDEEVQNRLRTNYICLNVFNRCIRTMERDGVKIESAGLAEKTLVGMVLLNISSMDPT